MSSASRDWLPPGVAAHASVRASLTVAVEAWAEYWFARWRPTVGAIDTVGSGALGQDSGRSWRRHGTSLCVNRPAGEALSLTAWLVDAVWDPLLLNAAERLIIDELETVLLTDFCRRLEITLGVSATAPSAPEVLPDPLGPDGGAVVEVKEGGGGLALRVAIPLAVLAAARKRALPARATPARPVESRLAALGKTEVRAEVRLGSAQLSLEDLQNLAPGDVVVLNTKLDGLALLAIEDTAKPFAHCRISNTKGQLSMTLEA